MSLNTCLMFSSGSVLSSGFHIGSLPWSGTAYLLGLAPLYLCELCCPLEPNLVPRQPQGATSVIQAITGEGFAQGPYVAAIEVESNQRPTALKAPCSVS